jgi:methylthioribose-1-phosphate isomerase
MSVSVAVPHSINWKGDSIALLNQTMLPTIVGYKALTTIEGVWKSIRKNIWKNKLK